MKHNAQAEKAEAKCLTRMYFIRENFAFAIITKYKYKNMYEYENPI
jgi:hypothetical protein